MDDLLSEFLTETFESLDVVDAELVNLEQDPSNEEVLGKIFRLVHTIKGTCGFLGLPRLEAVAHASENVLGKFRDGVLEVTPDCVTLILESIDQIKVLLNHLEQTEAEPDGNDNDLISRLNDVAEGNVPDAVAEEPDEPEVVAPTVEVSLEELEAAFQAAPGPDEVGDTVVEEAVAEPVAEAPAPQPKKAPEKKEDPKSVVAPRESSIANQSIRVNVDVLENLMTMVSELVLTRNQLLQMVRNQEESEFKVPLQRLSNVTSDLQEAVMQTRMQPIGNAWQKLPRIIRDLGQELGKQMILDMQGADTELDRQVLELIKDPLTHMVRNSADHGLETPDERREAGKPESGTITLKAFHEGGHIIIEIADDGKGLCADKIKAKAIQNGLVSEADVDKLTESQIQKFIFQPGFSTAQEVTAVSGRGVGMDVVRTNIEIIGGTVDVKSTEGKGSIFTIKIPLTLAIVSALIVEVAGQRYAVPQLSVIELVRAKAGSEYQIEKINNTPVLRLRNRLLPLVYLSEQLGIKPQEGEERRDDEGFVIVSQVGSQNFGVVVDGVFDTEEIVVKPVSTILREISMFSGNTILGDGSVIMILDPNGMAASVATTELDKEEVTEQRRMADNDDAISLLVFRAGGNEPKAVPLSLVTRLEEIDAADIETSNGERVVQYRGALMPLSTIGAGQSLATEGRQPVLVFSDKDRVVGLAVDEIVDIVEERLDVKLESSSPSLMGTAVVRDKATEVIDVSYYLTQVFSDWFSYVEEGNADSGKRVLFVDDSPFFQHLVMPMLTTAGYRVVTVGSVDDALELKEKGDVFDIIVSDIEMPEKDGIEFAELVRGDTEWADTPLVAFSAMASDAIADGALEAGFSEYVSKSDRDQLIKTIKDVLKRTENAA